MQKVVSINLNGNAYQLDEEAYEALHAYLERSQARLQANPDRAEILADIEQSIAEKCARFLGPRKTVVNAAEVNTILAEMGPVETAEPQAQPGAEAGATGAGSSSSTGADTGTPGGGGTPKRLYQIREGAMLTGVCKGIAAYFDVDVTLIRIVFVVLAFATFGIAVLVYAVLAFVIPYADTTEAHAAAYGLSATAQGLVDQAKRHHESFRARHAWRHEWQHRTSNRHWRRRYREMEEQMRAATQNAPMPPPPPMNYATSAILGVTTPVFAMLHAAAFVAWAYAVLSVLTTGAIFGWRIPIGGMPVWGSLVILFVLYAMLTGPLRAIRHMGYAHHRFPHHHSPFGALHGLLWLAFTAFFAWLAYQYIPQAHALIDSLPGAWHHTGGLNVEALMHRLDLDRLIARR